jgi:hypothetical protein
VKDSLRKKENEFIVTKKVDKSVRGMPWLSEAKKDVLSCEKLRGTAQKF